MVYITDSKKKCRVKLCGLMRKEDIEYANAVLPDYVGFVFAKSKRQITKEQAREFKNMLDKNIKAVGVFVDEDMESILEYLREEIIDIAQLHGNENEEYIVKLKSKTHADIIKAIVAQNICDIEKWYDTAADYLLIDSGRGTGKTFNWEDKNKFDWEKIHKNAPPFFLAGGLSPQNVEQAVKIAAPFGVDTSSGIETDGRKDFLKMKMLKIKVR